MKPARESELSRLRVRRGVVDDNGIMGLGRPAFLPPDASAEEEDAVDETSDEEIDMLTIEELELMFDESPEEDVT